MQHYNYPIWKQATKELTSGDSEKNRIFQEYLRMLDTWTRD